MDNNGNFNNNNGNFPQNTQNMQRPANAPPRGAVSKGEMFVATNLLSKIGVVFVIASVIAFSAASEGYIPAGVRMALVVAVGFIMLVVGAVFFKKGSPIFANALIYGGVAELFVSTLIGRFGFEVYSAAGAALACGVAAAVGVVMTRFTKSQGILIVTAALSIIPLFYDPDFKGLCAAAVFFIAVHFIVAVIARKYGCTAVYIIGMASALIEILALFGIGTAKFDLYGGVETLSVTFAVCCAVCYCAEPLLNAAEADGRMTDGETAALATALGFLTIFSFGALFSGIGNASAVIFLSVSVLVCAVLAAVYSLRFGTRCRVATVMFNIILASALLILMLVLDMLHAPFGVYYAAVHVYSLAVLVLGEFIDRTLFKIWGWVLFVFSEMLFLPATFMKEKLLIIAINIAVWIGVMIFFIIRKKTDRTLFQVYSALVFFNTGILGAYLISSKLLPLFPDMFDTRAQKTACSALICGAAWMLLGFLAGKLKYMKILSSVSSFTLYGIGLMCLSWANLVNAVTSSGEKMLSAGLIIVTVIVNVVSVLAVLDITLQIEEKAPKFAKAAGLIVSAYAIATLTTVLGTNDFVTFTNCIISIIYIATAVVWIVIGFIKMNAVLRRFGLALVLLSSAKLFLFDFRGVDAMGRTLLFIGFGITLLVISFSYGIAEKKLKEKFK